MNPKQYIKSLNQWRIERMYSKSYRKLYDKIISQNPGYKAPIMGGVEKQWFNRWQPLLRHYKLSPYSYRIFSHMAGESIDRLPLEVLVNVIEPTLNPSEYVQYYDDKNSLPHIMPLDWLPRTFLRSIRGRLFGEKGTIIKDPKVIIDSITCDSVIVKPSRDLSGHGVEIFRRTGDSFFNKGQEQLTAGLLKQRWGNDWLIQECVIQSEELNFFNPTSVNTIRIATYRALDGNIYPIGRVLRVGGKGAEVDNAHAGGMFCGINEDGRLGNYFCNYLGKTQTDFNGINLKETNFRISNFDKILEFVCKAASKIEYLDLVAFDVAVTKDGSPKIIEINVSGFSAWLFEMTQKSTFGSYTEEVIKRCKNNVICSWLHLFEI